MTRGINLAESNHKSFSNKYEATSSKKPVVFLSHKSEDKSFVDSIGNYLMDAGINIYLDKNDPALQSADRDGNAKQVTECIQKGIEECDYLLCIVSENTKLSWWVPYEIGYGKNAGKHISTLLKKDVDDIPDYLKIEELVRNIDELNKYIKKITSNYKMPLKEYYSSGIDSSEAHITATSSSNNLSTYMEII